jgi:hypothetical protein
MLQAGAGSSLSLARCFVFLFLKPSVLIAHAAMQTLGVCAAG